MDKLDQVRGVLRGIKNIAMQGIYADTFRGMEAQCVGTYRKCIATLKTVSGFEDIEGLAPDLTDNATMQEIGFAVEMVLSLVSEGGGPVTGRGMRGWMQHGAMPAGRSMPPLPPIPPIPPVPPVPHMHGMHDRCAWRKEKRQLREHFRRGFRGAHSAEHGRRLEELQDEMQERIEEEQERFEESVENMEEKMEELQEKIEEMRERLQERLEEIREKYEEKVEELQEAAEEAEDAAEEAEDDEDDEDVDEPRS